MGGPEIIIPHTVTNNELCEMLDGEMTFKNAIHKFFPNFATYNELEYEIIRPSYYGDYNKNDYPESFGLKIIEPVHHHGNTIVGGLGLSHEGIGLLIMSGKEFFDKGRSLFQLTYLKPFKEHTRVFDLIQDNEGNWVGTMTAHPKMATVKMSLNTNREGARFKLDSYMKPLNKLIVEDYLFGGK